MKKLTSYELLLNTAAQTPKPERIELKAVSVRIKEPLYDMLNSMAKVLGKSASGLAGELLEAMIIRFDEELPELRPDLTIREHGCGFDDYPDTPIREDEDGDFICRWDNATLAEEAFIYAQQNLLPQEDAKNGKAS